MPAEALSAHLIRTRNELQLADRGELINISAVHALRSTTLSEVLENSAEGDVIPISLEGMLLQMWLAYVENPKRFQDSAVPVEELVGTLQVLLRPYPPVHLLVCSCHLLEAL